MAFRWHEPVVRKHHEGRRMHRLRNSERHFRRCGVVDSLIHAVVERRADRRIRVRGRISRDRLCRGADANGPGAKKTLLLSSLAPYFQSGIWETQGGKALNQSDSPMGGDFVASAYISIANPHCFKLLRQVISQAFSLALAKAGRSIAAKMAMTTSNSIRVNPVAN
jgi:hypothetical protein